MEQDTAVKRSGWMGRLTTLLSDKGIFRIAYLTFLVVNMFTVFNITLVSRIVLAVFTVWSGLIILYDLVKRGLKYYRDVALMIVFLLICLVSYLVNFERTGLRGVLTLYYSAVCILILLKTDLKDRDSLKVELSRVATAYAAVASLGALISVIMFITQTFFLLRGWTGQNIRVGVFNNRLHGVFSSPNVGGTIVLIGVAFWLLNLTFMPHARVYKLIAVLGIVASLAYVSLGSSRGTVVSAVVGLAAFFLFCDLSGVRRMPSSAWKQGLIRLAGLLLSVILLFTVLYGLRSILAYAPAVRESIQESAEEPAEGEEGVGEPFDFTRVEESMEDVGVSNGRLNIWTASLKYMDGRYWLGIGNSAVKSKDEPTIVDSLSRAEAIALNGARGNTHNGYLQIFVNCGIFALLSFLLFLISRFFRSVKAYRSFTDPEARNLYALLIATVFYVASNNLFETNIMLMGANSIQAVFWLVIGNILALGQMAGQTPAIPVKR